MVIAFLIAAAAPASPALFDSIAAADRRLVAIGRRLARGGAGLCAGRTSNPGWTIEDSFQFEPSLRADAKKALTLGGYPTVVDVEPGSPAAAAGVTVGDEILGIEALKVPIAAPKRASRERMQTVETGFARAAADGVSEVTILRAGQRKVLTIAPEPGCPTDFLIGNRRGLRGASSNGTQVAVSGEILDFVGSDDELALILAHELAHNILGHNRKGPAATRVAGEDRSGESTRSREGEADRWALYLMARAGYDPGRAPGLWRRWGPKTSFGIFNDGSHPGWRNRAAAAEAEIARIRTQQAAGQQPVP